MVEPIIATKRKKKSMLFSAIAKLKYYRLVRNIESLLDKITNLTGKSRDEILSTAGIFLEDGKIGPSMTLADLSALEGLGFGTVITLSDDWSNLKINSSGAMSSAKFKSGVRLDPDIPDAMLDELIARNANWRVYAGRNGSNRDSFVTFAIPQDIADKHGIEYSKEWWINAGKFALTDNGFVVKVKGVTRSPSGAFILSTIFGPGFHKGNTTYFINMMATNALDYEFPLNNYKNTDFERLMSYEFREIEESAFAEAYVATGNKWLATMLSGMANPQNKLDFSKRVNMSKVLQMVEERTRSAMESAFRRLGIGENPEEFVVGTLIEMTKMIMDKTKEDGATLNPKLMNVVQDNMDKLSDFLAMKSENRTVTTERTLELGEGDRIMIAREIEKRKGILPGQITEADVEILQQDELING